MHTDLSTETMYMYWKTMDVSPLCIDVLTGAVSTVNPHAATNPRASANKSISKQNTSADVSENSWDSDGHDHLDISELK